MLPHSFEARPRKTMSQAVLFLFSGSRKEYPSLGSPKVARPCGGRAQACPTC